MRSQAKPQTELCLLNEKHMLHGAGQDLQRFSVRTDPLQHKESLLSSISIGEFRLLQWV